MSMILMVSVSAASHGRTTARVDFAERLFSDLAEWENSHPDAAIRGEDEPVNLAHLEAWAAYDARYGSIRELPNALPARGELEEIIRSFPTFIDRDVVDRTVARSYNRYADTIADLYDEWAELTIHDEFLDTVAFTYVDASSVVEAAEVWVEKTLGAGAEMQFGRLMDLTGAGVETYRVHVSAPPAADRFYCFTLRGGGR